MKLQKTVFDNGPTPSLHMFGCRHILSDSTHESFGRSTRQLTRDKVQTSSERFQVLGSKSLISSSVLSLVFLTLKSLVPFVHQVELYAQRSKVTAERLGLVSVSIKVET